MVARIFSCSVVAVFMVDSAQVVTAQSDGKAHRPPRAAEAAPVESTQSLEEVWSVDGAWFSVIESGEHIMAFGNGDRLGVFNSRGQLVRESRVPSSASQIRPARLTDDEFPGLVAFDTWSKEIKAFDSDGHTLWSYATEAGVDDVWTADLDGDGLDEVVVGQNASGGLHVLDAQGRMLWKHMEIGNVWHVTAGDINGDGRTEVLATSAVGQVHVFDSDGRKITDLNPGFDGVMVRLALPDRDGKGETILVGGRNSADLLMVTAFDLKGENQWTTQLPKINSIDSMSAARSQPWVAVGARGGRVIVINRVTGEIIAESPIKAYWGQLAWVNTEDGPPLLVVPTEGRLSALRVTED